MIPANRTLLSSYALWDRYKMWDADDDDADAFEHRLDSVVREIGERGKIMVPESVPPLHMRGPVKEPTPAPAPATVLAPALASTPAQALAPRPAPAPSPPPAPSVSTSATPSLVPRQFSSSEPTPNAFPSVERQPMVMQPHSGTTSFAATSETRSTVIEVSAFMMEQLRVQVTEQRVHDKAQHEDSEAKLEAQQQRHEAQLMQYEAKLEAQRNDYEAKLEAQRNEYEAKLQGQLQDSKTYTLESKLQGLQERLDGLHQAKLLTDDEMFALEDIVVDFIECRSVGTSPPGEIGVVVESVTKLVGVCEGVSKDGMLARQLRRKFL